MGHTSFWEHRHLVFIADLLGLSQVQFNDFVNANHNWCVMHVLWLSYFSVAAW